MRDDAITQIAKLIDPDFDYGSDAVQADMRALALECFSVFLPSTMEILSERKALREENARLLEAVKAAYYEGWQDNASREYSRREIQKDWETSEACAAIRDGGKDG